MKGASILMPDGHEGWIRTNPRIDANVAHVLQENHNKLFRKVVKLLKYWNTEQLNGAISSYFIELSIARVFWDKAVKSEQVATLSYGLALAFWAVQQAVIKGMQSSWVANAPPVYPGGLLAGHLILMKSHSDLACTAWEDEKAGKPVSAFAKWPLDRLHCGVPRSSRFSKGGNQERLQSRIFKRADGVLCFRRG